MRFLETFITVVIFIPVFAVILYTIFYPRESALFGKRWQFKNEDLEPSEEAIKYNHNVGIAMLIIAAIIAIITILKIWNN